MLYGEKNMLPLLNVLEKLSIESNLNDKKNIIEGKEQILRFCSNKFLGVSYRKEGKRI